jgi:hypothetical protein
MCACAILCSMPMRMSVRVSVACRLVAFPFAYLIFHVCGFHGVVRGVPVHSRFCTNVRHQLHVCMTKRSHSDVPRSCADLLLFSSVSLRAYIVHDVVPSNLYR